MLSKGARTFFLKQRVSLLARQKTPLSQILFPLTDLRERMKKRRSLTDRRLLSTSGEVEFAYSRRLAAFFMVSAKTV